MITYIVISSNKEIPDLEDLEIAKILDTIQLLIKKIHTLQSKTR